MFSALWETAVPGSRTGHGDGSRNRTPRESLLRIPDRSEVNSSGPLTSRCTGAGGVRGSRRRLYCIQPRKRNPRTYSTVPYSRGKVSNLNVLVHGIKNTFDFSRKKVCSHPLGVVTGRGAHRSHSQRYIRMCEIVDSQLSKSWC